MCSAHSARPVPAQISQFGLALTLPRLRPRRFRWLPAVTGLFALTLYYYGLQRTPAVLSSLAELTYPAVAVIAGIYAYDAQLHWTQWLGVALILGAVTLLPVQRRRVVSEPAPRELVPAAAAG